MPEARQEVKGIIRSDKLHTRQGYLVRQAITGAVALQAIQKYSPDLILLDIRMPEMDGYELCKKLKEEPQTWDIPVIFISALEDASNKIKALNIGGVDYITKPFHPEEVLAHVKTHLTLQQLRKELEKKNGALQQEINGHTRSEKLLRESEERYRQLVELSPDPIVVLQNGEYQFVNSAFTELFGYTQQDVEAGLSFFKLVQEPDKKAVLKRYEERLANKPLPKTHDIDLVSKNGKLIACETSATLISMGAEDEVRSFNAELEERVSRRTAELEAANRELASFAYVVSHDLKAPLRGISHLAHWFIEDYAEAFDEKGREMTELLIGRVKRMENLIDGILEYSRVGRIVRENTPIKLNSLVQDIIDSFAATEQIQFVIADELPVVIGDATRIAQVFQNLLNNAVEYMDKPQGKVTINCVDEGDVWKFSIADNGPGIESKYHEKNFHIFQSLTPRDIHESTGIGLALVKKIIELHGGIIGVESTPGQGSTFWFTLPKHESELEAV